jgi:L-threonylcarbamoyladenylate synthase
MRTEILAVDPLSPQPDIIGRAAAVIRRGGLVAFPTETVYGLGANALDATAVGRIFEAKGRPAKNPIIVHIAESSDARRIVSDWPSLAATLAERFWPGPLSLVLPKRAVVPDIVTAAGPTVAVRLPAHPVARALILAADTPIAAPSANPSNRLSPTFAEHVLEGLDGHIDIVLDGGPAAGGLESTVLDLTCTPPRILRPGLVSPHQLEGCIGAVQRPFARERSAEVQLASPGLLPRHYSPRTPMECIEDSGIARVAELSATGLRIGWLAPMSFAARLTSNVHLITMPAEVAAYAAVLYAVLHELDHRGLDRIVVSLPPAEDAWLAVRDRLIRAQHA